VSRYLFAEKAIDEQILTETVQKAARAVKHPPPTRASLAAA
jgi:hypothetical protein